LVLVVFLLLLAVNWIESVSLLPRLLNSISFSAQSSFIQRPLSSFIAIISFYRRTLLDYLPPPQWYIPIIERRDETKENESPRRKEGGGEGVEHRGSRVVGISEWGGGIIGIQFLLIIFSFVFASSSPQQKEEREDGRH
jgi:hypothetical protein